MREIGNNNLRRILEVLLVAWLAWLVSVCAAVQKVRTAVFTLGFVSELIELCIFTEICDCIF